MSDRVQQQATETMEKRPRGGRDPLIYKVCLFPILFFVLMIATNCIAVGAFGLVHTSDASLGLVGAVGFGMFSLLGYGLLLAYRRLDRQRKRQLKHEYQGAFGAKIRPTENAVGFLLFAGVVIAVATGVLGAHAQGALSPPVTMPLLIAGATAFAFGFDRMRQRAEIRRGRKKQRRNEEAEALAAAPVSTETRETEEPKGVLPGSTPEMFDGDADGVGGLEHLPELSQLVLASVKAGLCADEVIERFDLTSDSLEEVLDDLRLRIEARIAPEAPMDLEAVFKDVPFTRLSKREKVVIKALHEGALPAGAAFMTGLNTLQVKLIHTRFLGRVLENAQWSEMARSAVPGTKERPTGAMGITRLPFGLRLKSWQSVVLAAFLVVVLAVGGWLIFLQPEEAKINGKPIGHWVEQLLDRHPDRKAEAVYNLRWATRRDLERHENQLRRAAEEGNHDARQLLRKKFDD